MSVMNKERVVWLDYARFFSVFLVILFHTPPMTRVFDGRIACILFYTVFFTISGYLFDISRYSNFRQFFTHRGKQILVPYVTFFMVVYPLWLLVGRTLSGEDVEWWLPLANWLKGEPHTVVGTFWFLACLLVMQIFYYFLQRWLPSRWLIVVALLLSVAAANCPLENYWQVWYALLYMPYYAFGNLFKDYLSQVRFDTSKHTAALLIGGAVAIAIMGLSIFTADPNIINVVRITSGVLVIPAYVAISKWLGERYGCNGVIELVVMNAIVYLAFQNNVISVIRVALEKVFYHGVMTDHLWIKFVVALAVMVILYPIAWFVHHYAPWMLGRKKKAVAH